MRRLGWCLAALVTAVPAPLRAGEGGADPPGFWPSAVCAGCHVQQVEEHFRSGHEGSFTNPLFQAQYFELVLPRAARDPSYSAAAKGCTACHAPVSYAKDRNLATTAGVTDPSLAGVTCGLCHAIVGYDGPAPGNGNFVVSPGSKKYGPFRKDGSHHGAYSALHARSEFCAVCHEAVNGHGLRVKATFSEWRESAFAQAGVHCQDCHMSRDGVLVAGGRYASGQVSADGLSRAPPRERIYSHRFPGVRSGAPIEGALKVTLREIPARAPAGQPLTVSLLVDNSRTAHSLPTGSADLRLLWVEVTARVGDVTIPVPAENLARGSWGAAGDNGEDALVLGSDIPVGSRLYRAVFLDRRGRQTLASFEATRIAFDNRLLSGERRSERYTVAVPRDATGSLRLEARLRYRAFPTALARELDVAPPGVVEVARVAAEITLDPPPDEPPAPAAAREHLTPMQHLERLRRRKTP